MDSPCIHLQSWNNIRYRWVAGMVLWKANCYQPNFFWLQGKVTGVVESNRYYLLKLQLGSGSHCHQQSKELAFEWVILGTLAGVNRKPIFENEEGKRAGASPSGGREIRSSPSCLRGRQTADPTLRAPGNSRFKTTLPKSMLRSNNKSQPDT